MELNTATHNPSFQFHKAAGKNGHDREASIEARLHFLGERVETLNSDSRLVWLKDGPHIYDPELDLSVKIEAVRWMLRIARHLNESAREVVLARVQSSLAQLERTLEAAHWSSAT